MKYIVFQDEKEKNSVRLIELLILASFLIHPLSTSLRNNEKSPAKPAIRFTCGQNKIRVASY